MELIGLFPARFLIKKWLKAGVMIGMDLTPTESGTPQGGIISPLLANIALHGMEEAIGVKRVNRKHKDGSRSTAIRGHTKIVKYADDFVVLTETEAQAKEAQRKLVGWLDERGLKLSPEKTRLTKVTDGLDFLGFTIIRRKNAQSRNGYATHTIPSKKSVKGFKEKVDSIIRNNLQSSPDKLLRELNPLITGWAYYYRMGVCYNVFRRLDDYTYHKLWKWAKRRHPNKGKRWVYNRYYTEEKNRRWRLRGKNGGTQRKLTDVKSKRHVMVAGQNSPDDPELTAYWIRRRSKNNSELGVRAAIYDKQKGICEECDDWLENGEAVHVHHKDGNRENWRLSNLSLVHETCHHQITVRTRRTA
jgi:RNA-directed DNA polymerase